MKARVNRIAVIALLSVLALAAAALAQTASSPTLDDVLQQLDSNLHRYEAQVPDFFCSEHIVSSQAYAGKRQFSVNDSIFRLQRVTHPGSAATLDESREATAVNGTSVEGKQIQGPAILGGVFSGGLDVVSLSQRSCMSYALEPTLPGEPYVIQFATLPGRHANCLLTEESRGRVFIDPATMQVKRMELIAPHHTILPQTVGVWRITIDYAPVLLDARTFWMPTTIASTAISTFDGNQTVWAFDARYSSYHRLEVTSRILPPSSPATQ
ncbi:MAG TPA: hypothetical protein VMU57_05080 [Edaphobacter sp.]|uniref:hypothetical protein n=1 Tax=Edaphobacter sp. TaxID=1934404 RepID=UPI002B55C212|nr:hypothetical protein [Edaphobacter sp.]HUZ94267.1 hypothetical protein [Edaphobacter sp.]